MAETRTRLERLLVWWRWAERFLLGLSMITMSLLVMGNVVSRQVFGDSWAFTQEVGGLLLIVITFGGLSHAAEQRRHINMSAIHDLLPPGGRRILDRVIELVTALVMVAMAYIAGRYVVQIADSGDVSSVLQIPMAIPLAIIPLAFLLTALRYLAAFFGHSPPHDADPAPAPRDSTPTPTPRDSTPTARAGGVVPPADRGSPTEEP